MPIALNHTLIRQTLRETLAHFDSTGQAPASSGLVLLGHSMGGVIARLMVSSADQSLVQLAEDRGQLSPAQIKRISPLVRFEPVPQVSRAIFAAAPHRGTTIAGGRLGLWVASLVRLPVTVLEEFTQLLIPTATAGSHERLRAMPNSINNLNKDDPFVRVAASLPISPSVRYHSIIAQADPKVALIDSDDGLVPYLSAHLPGALSEKIIISGHSVQQNAAAILEIRRILQEDIVQNTESVPDRDQVWNAPLPSSQHSRSSTGSRHPNP